MDRLHQPHPRRALRRRGRAAGRRRARSNGSSAGSTTRAGSSTGPRTSTSCRPTAPARRATSRPGEFQHDGVRLDGRLLRPRAQRRSATTRGTSTSPPTSTSCRSTARSARSPRRPASTARHGVARRPHGGVPRRRRPVDLPAERARRRDRRRAAASIAGLSRRLDRTFETTAGGAARAWLDDDDAAGHRRGSR